MAASAMSVKEYNVLKQWFNPVSSQCRFQEKLEAFVVWDDGRVPSI
jgi:hypothetical protein